MKTTKPATEPLNVTLSTSDQKHLEKLKELRRRLESGQHVQNKTLKIWLTPKEFEEIEIRYGMQHEMRDFYNAKPSEIQEYETEIKKARFEYSKGEHFSLTRKYKAAKARHNSAQSLYELALTKLRSAATQNPSLTSWFDRNVFDESIGLSPLGMPTVRTSRSMENQSTIEYQSKSEIKIDVINQAIERIEGGRISIIENSETSNEHDEEKLMCLMKELRAGSKKSLRK